LVLISFNGEHSKKGTVAVLENLRVILDLINMVLGVLPPAYFPFKTYPHLEAVNIEEGKSAWERLGIEL
jgi:hypothetical protein